MRTLLAAALSLCLSCRIGYDNLPNAGEIDGAPGAGDADLIDSGTLDANTFDLCAADPCNGRGWCTNGVCDCDPGYAGANCDTCDGIWESDVTDPLQCQPTNEINGTPGDDTLETTGSIEDDLIRGLEGNDIVRGLDGSDFVNGNIGIDSVFGDGGRDEVHGGSEDDMLDGGADNDVLFGDAGNDILLGGEGSDRLIGGDGDDVLRGGEGDDRYVIDGLGNDTFDDLNGDDAARCVPGVRITDQAMQGADVFMTLSTGGTVTILGASVESILGCD